MRSRAQIFSGSAYEISASTWNSVTTTPSMTRWSTLGNEELLSCGPPSIHSVMLTHNGEMAARGKTKRK